MKKPDNKDLLINAQRQGVPTTKGDRVLVWHDEFEDRSSITENWFFRTQMRSSDASLNTDEKHIDVKNGQLELHRR